MDKEVINYLLAYNDLKIILDIIKNNLYSILNETYFPIIFFKDT